MKKMKTIPRFLQLLLLVIPNVLGMTLSSNGAPDLQTPTCCSPHDPSHRISVFGSRMAHAPPRYRTPAPGHRLEALSTNGRFYVHIWDFNKRVIARSKNFSGFDSPGHLIYKPARLARMYHNRDSTSDHSATVCHTSFPTRDFEGLFLEQDRLTLTWVRPDTIDIQVSPVLETKGFSCWLRDYVKLIMGNGHKMMVVPGGQRSSL